MVLNVSSVNLIRVSSMRIISFLNAPSILGACFNHQELWFSYMYNTICVGLHIKSIKAILITYPYLAVDIIKEPIPHCLYFYDMALAFVMKNKITVVFVLVIVL